MNREGRPGSRDPGRLGDAIELFLRQSNLWGNLANSRVFQAWNEALGPRLAAHARPVRFQRGELRIQVDSAAHLHELQNFTGDRYRAETNALLGEERIRRVVFKLRDRS